MVYKVPSGTGETAQQLGERKKYSIGPGVWTSSELGIGAWQISPPRVASAEAVDPG